MRSRRKLGILIFVALALIALVCIILIIINYYFNRNSTTVFAEDVKKEVLLESKLSKLPNNITRQLEAINNPKLSDEERFKALSNLAFYFSMEYMSSHNPETRKFSKDVLGGYAKKEFPKMYNESLFNFVCSDPECGQELSPEIKNVLKLIKSSNLSPIYKDTVTKNLTSAGFMPDSELVEKKYGFVIVIDDLQASGNKDASAAAKILKDYANKKYKMNL